MALLLFRLLTLVVLYLIQKLIKKLEKYELWTTCYNFFRAVNFMLILNFLIEVYFEMALVSSVVKPDDLLTTTSGEIIACVFWFICVISTRIIVPTVLAYSLAIVAIDKKTNSPVNFYRFSLT